MGEAEYQDWVAAVRERLRAARLALGLSYRAAQKATGVPFQTITRVETGRVAPTSEVLYKLAVGYGLTLNEVLCGAPPARRGRKPGPGRPG